MDTYDLLELDEGADDGTEWMDGEGFDVDSESFDADEVDEMLDEMMDSDEDYSERRRRRPRPKRRPVLTARGRTAYRPPAKSSAFVTQKQLQTALGRVGTDVRRNAQGIKGLNGRVNGVVAVNKVQSRSIGRIDKTMKIDGALELVEAYNGSEINAYQLLKGAVKSGYLGQGKGPLSNPLVIGGIGLVLRQPGIVSGLLTPTP